MEQSVIEIICQMAAKCRPLIEVTYIVTCAAEKKKINSKSHYSNFCNGSQTLFHTLIYYT